MFDDLNQFFGVVMLWLDQLHTPAVQVGVFIMHPASLGLMMGYALWFFLFAFGLTVGRFK